MTTGVAETPVQPALTARQGGPNPRSAATGAASVTVVRGNADEEPMDVMSAVASASWGLPTVLDRFIQQARHQVLSPEFEPGFSESSSAKGTL